jgi:hypothetical protein
MENNCNVAPRPRNIKDLLKSWYLWKPFLAIVIGGIVGFVIFYFLSCNAGVCIISESTYTTIITGSLFGFMLTNSPCLKCATVKK